MKTFNFKRFGVLLKWRLQDIKSTAFRTAAIMVLVLSLLAIIQDFNGHFAMQVAMGEGKIVEDMSQTAALIGRMIMVLSLIYWSAASSLLLYDFKRKHSTVSELMLPASNLEKFLSRWVIVVLGAIVLLAAVMVVVDAVQYVFVAVQFGQQEAHSALLESIRVLSSDMSWGWGTLRIMILLLFANACYLLGGVIFKSNAYLWTTIVLLLVSYASSWLFRFSVFDVLFMTDVHHVVMKILLVLLAVGCYRVAYQQFKRLQVVQHKWFYI